MCDIRGFFDYCTCEIQQVLLLQTQRDTVVRLSYSLWGIEISYSVVSVGKLGGLEGWPDSTSPRWHMRIIIPNGKTELFQSWIQLQTVDVKKDTLPKFFPASLGPLKSYLLTQAGSLCSSSFPISFQGFSLAVELRGSRLPTFFILFSGIFVRCFGVIYVSMGICFICWFHPQWWHLALNMFVRCCCLFFLICFLMHQFPAVWWKTILLTTVRCLIVKSQLDECSSVNG